MLLSIYYGTEKNEYTHQPEIFGVYNLQAGLINGRNYYEKGEYGIWFNAKGHWMIGYSFEKGTVKGYAIVKKDIPFPDSTTNWERVPGWTKANKGLGVKGIYL